MKQIFALRVKAVGEYPPNVRCPWQVGAFVAWMPGGMGGFVLQNVFEVNKINFYTSRRDAERDVLNAKDYPIVLEIVEWKQTK